MGFPGQAAYIACKHAVIGLTKTACLDYASKGIRINAVLPGVIATPMAKDLMKRNPAADKELLRDIPAGRLEEPYGIAHAVMWLVHLIQLLLMGLPFQLMADLRYTKEVFYV